jgi:hypothetical protein
VACRQLQVQANDTATQLAGSGEGENTTRTNMTFNAEMEHILKLDSLRLGGEVRKGETGCRLKDAEEADRQQG